MIVNVSSLRATWQGGNVDLVTQRRETVLLLLVDCREVSGQALPQRPALSGAPRRLPCLLTSGLSTVYNSSEVGSRLDRLPLKALADSQRQRLVEWQGRTTRIGHRPSE